ncbi:MAG: hypothetical protein Ta2D_05200 [Rickettsiales bacterium]|nr:MAG: hypothetical protein Ta2D_05200 [Rickettsiales bacterium]
MSINFDVIKKISVDDVLDFVNDRMAQIVSVILAIIVISVACLLYSSHTKKRDELFITEFYRANKLLIEGDQDKSRNMLSSLFNNKKTSESIKTIAGIRLANISNTDNALKILLQVFHFKNNDIYLRNLAGLNALTILINENNVEKFDNVADLLKELKHSSNPLLDLVIEQEGIFTIQKGEVEQGKSILSQLLKKDIGSEQKKRIDSILNLY